jgi:hypothetical protein
MAQVRLHRVFAEHEPGGDLRVGQSLDDQRRHLSLLTGELPRRRHIGGRRWTLGCEHDGDRVVVARRRGFETEDARRGGDSHHRGQAARWLRPERGDQRSDGRRERPADAHFGPAQHVEPGLSRWRAELLALFARKKENPRCAGAAGGAVPERALALQAQAQSPSDEGRPQAHEGGVASVPLTGYSCAAVVRSWHLLSARVGGDDAGWPPRTGACGPPRVNRACGAVLHCARGLAPLRPLRR